MADALNLGSSLFYPPGFGDYMNPWFCSGTTMACEIHICPRKCHKPQDHKDMACPRKQVQLPCGHRVSRGCHQLKTLPDTCFACKLAKRKAGASEAADENGAVTSDRPSTPVDPQPPVSPTSSWRDRQTATAGNNKSWRGGRSMDQSTNVFDKYCGPSRSTDTYKDGLFGRPKPQPDSLYSSQGESNPKDTWRPTRSKW